MSILAFLLAKIPARYFANFLLKFHNNYKISFTKSKISFYIVKQRDFEFSKTARSSLKLNSLFCFWARWVPKISVLGQNGKFA